MAAPAKATQNYIERYQAARPGLPGGSLPWLAQLRDAGIARFGALGFPSPKIESWKYTDLRPLERLAAEAVPAASTEVALPAPLLAGGHRLVFVNGQYQAGLSAPGDLPAGLRLQSLRAVLEAEPDSLQGWLGGLGGSDDEAMTALNLALMTDGLVLRLAPGIDLATPIELVFAGTGTALTAHHPRNLILLEAGSRATLVEQHVGSGSYIANSVSQVALGQGAALRHVKVQNEAGGAYHIGTVTAELGRDAAYENFVLSLGSRLARNEIRVRLAGQGAACRLDGIYLGRGRQHLDHTTVLDHLAPHTTSRELYKGALDETGRAVFQGRITVHPHAQKSDGHLLNKTLLLSAGAEVDTKPELEIYADDVKCGHGAATGDLDPTALFYLRSRGMPERLARRLLVEAFVGEVIDDLSVADLQQPLRDRAGAWLAAWSDDAKHE